MAFAARGLALGMKELEIFYASKNRDMIKKRKSDLSNALRDYFQITGDPIVYRKRGKVYLPNLIIREGDTVDLEVWLEKWREDR